MRPIYEQLTQVSAAAAQVVVPLDIYLSPFQVSYTITQVSGNIRATVAVTDDDVFSSTFDQSAATWFGQGSATNVSGSTMGTIIDFPVTALRLSLAGGLYSGGCTLTVIQAGITS